MFFLVFLKNFIQYVQHYSVNILDHLKDNLIQQINKFHFSFFRTDVLSKLFKNLCICTKF